MNQTEFQPCAACGKGVMHAGAPQFYRLTVQPHIINTAAIQRQAGLEQMLGGHATIAFHMGMQEHLAQPFGEPVVMLLCQDCGITGQSVAWLLEKTEEGKDRIGGSDGR